MFQIGLIILVAFIIFGTLGTIISPQGQKSFKSVYKAGKNIVSSSTPTPSPTLIPTLTLTSTLTHTPTPIPKPKKSSYDSTRGNNYVAAKYAQQFQDIADRISGGAVVDTYLELFPEDMQGKSEDTYKKDLISENLTVLVTNDFCNSLDHNSRKDLVATYVNSLRNIFSGIPHVYFKNSVRTVAEGGWSMWSGEANVTLK